VRDFKMVVDQGCMKCLDCVSACPEQALHVGFGKPAFMAKHRDGANAPARKYDLSLPVTLVVAAALLAVVLVVFLVAVSFLDRIVALVPEGSPGRGVLSQLLPYQQRPSVIAKAVAWSFVVQAGGAVGVALSARALGVDQPLSVWFSVVPLVALLMVLPVNIGGFGVREESMKFLLSQEGVPSDRAVGVALLWGLSTIIIGLVGGVLFLLDREPTTTAAKLPED
jgi:uncharacterized membrane protein YbhN (UPF0104 family)